MSLSKREIAAKENGQIVSGHDQWRKDNHQAANRPTAIKLRVRHLLEHQAVPPAHDSLEVPPWHLLAPLTRSVPVVMIRDDATLGEGLLFDWGSGCHRRRRGCAVADPRSFWRPSLHRPRDPQAGDRGCVTRRRHIREAAAPVIPDQIKRSRPNARICTPRPNLHCLIQSRTLPW